jgi:hypothetical protein
MIIIQKIQVWWGKESRGAPGAVLRNAVPKSLSIHSLEGLFLFEEYCFIPWYMNVSERYEGFQPKLSQHLYTDQVPGKIANLLLDYQNDELRIGFHWDERVGKPSRYDKKTALRLQSGMYGRLIVNGRHVEYDIHNNVHHYIQDTYNIAVVNQPTLNLFTSQEPDQICDLRAHLF